MRSDTRPCGSRFVALVVCVLTVLSLAPHARQVADYTVAAQDVLAVAVFDQAELSGKYVVDGDGTIAFPMIGRVRVGGLTTRDIERELKRHLGDGFFKDPQVTVGVERFRSQQVFVIGEVRSPGAFPLTGGMTIIEALARAGSTTADASHEAIVVRPGNRAPDGSPTGVGTQNDDAGVLTVNLAALATGVLAENLALKNGDTVIVKKVDTIFVLGQVKSPGAYPAQKGTTVLQAISMAGGTTDRGSTGRVRIARVVNGKSQEIRARLADLVQAGDTIIVLERIL